MESVDNGRENWGIPKELADFRFETAGPGRRRVTVSQGGVTLFSATISKYGLSFPVSTRLMPLPLVQRLNGKFYYTQFNGSGTEKLARLSDVAVNVDFIPAIGTARPLAGIGVHRFAMEFPIARVESAEPGAV